jgi:hypothetical protein
MSKTERLLNTWPCGCQRWVVATVDGDTIEEETTERFEPCPRFQALLAERQEIEQGQVRDFVKQGRNDAALLRELERVEGEIEQHHDVMHEVQTLQS